MILDRLETGLTRLESFLVEMVAKVGPWVSPLPTAYLTSQATVEHLGWPQPMGIAAGLVVESLGLAATALGMPTSVERKRFGYKTVLLGMSVLGSATAAVALSKEADDTFEEYKTAGDLDRMNELFDRAESLDNWSVGCWIASEVALGLLLYHLLHDSGPADDGPGAEPAPGMHSGGGR